MPLYTWKENSIMAAINHDVTEEQLKDAYNAVIAVQKEKGH